MMANNPTEEATKIVEAWKRILGVTLRAENVQAHLDRLRKAGAIPATTEE